MSGEFIPSEDNSKKIISYRPEVLKDFFEDNFKMPERLIEKGSDEFDMEICKFLIDEGYIKTINQWEDSWGFAYSPKRKCIDFPTLNMPEDSYEYFVFRLGVFSDGTVMFPQRNEIDTYRFQHEVGHAFQYYLMEKEAGNEVDWKTRTLDGSLDSPFSRLYRFCYEKRRKSSFYSVDGLSSFRVGLTSWGNQPYNELWDGSLSYKNNVMNQNIMGATEDSNDLVNMRLWHSKYLDEYLRYLTLLIPGYNIDSVENDRLASLTIEEGRKLRDLIRNYILYAKAIVPRSK